MIRETVFALITGIVSAVMYSFIQACYSYLTWNRTRGFFLQSISGTKTLIGYNTSIILGIDVIYETKEGERLVSHEEFIDIIESKDIKPDQFERLNKVISATKDKIESLRKEALSIPTFSSRDFHAVDRFIMELGNFNSAYYFFVEELNDDPTLSDSLKEKLIVILNMAEERFFTHNLLDNVSKWLNRRKFRKIMKKQKSEVPF